MNVSLPTRIPQNDDSVSMLLARLIGSANRSTLLASAARTADTASAQLDLFGVRAAFLFFNVTVVGTGTIRVYPQYLDPVSGTWFTPLNVPATAITTAQSYPIIVGAGLAIAPGSSLNLGALASLPLTSAMRFLVDHSDASSWTYSLGIETV